MMRLAWLIALPALLAAQTPEQLFEQRKFDEARAAFQSQLANDKNDANALYYMGRIAEAQDKSAEAVDWFDNAVKRNDGSALPFLRRQSRWNDAFATYEQLMKAKPDEITAHAGWGFTAAQSGTNLERGERELKLFLANLTSTIPTPTIAAAHFRMGQIYEKTGRKDLAKTEYVEALRVNPQHPEVKKALDALK